MPQMMPEKLPRHRIRRQDLLQVDLPLEDNLKLLPVAVRFHPKVQPQLKHPVLWVSKRWLERN